MKELRIETKLNKLAKNLDIRFIKGTNISILNIAEYIGNTKNLISSDVEMNKLLASDSINLFFCCFNNY